jgi:integrase
MQKFWVIWRGQRQRWAVTVQEENGRRQIAPPIELARVPGAAGRRAVEQWATKMFDKPEGAFVEPTLGEIVPRFLAHAESDERVEPATASAYRTDLTRWALPFVPDPKTPTVTFATLTIPELTLQRLRAWVRHLRTNLAPQSCRNKLYSLAACITLARSEEWTKAPSNPAQDDAVRSELPELERREVEILEHAAVEALCSGKGYAEGNAFEVPLVWRLRYALGALAGLEDGAIAGLQLSDVERGADGITLAIRRAVKIRGSNGWASPGNTKNQHRGTEKAPRRIPAHPVLATLIIEWIADGWELWTGLGRGPMPDDWLLPRMDGQPWRPRSADVLRRHLAKLGIRAQVGASEFKALRAWFATELEATGASENVRKRLMGHCAISTAAQFYTAEQRDLDRQAVERIRINGRHQNQSGRNECGRIGRIHDCSREGIGRIQRNEGNLRPFTTGPGPSMALDESGACDERGNAAGARWVSRLVDSEIAHDKTSMDRRVSRRDGDHG